METINPKSMFTKGQTAYSIALLSYKDDETDKIITHTISKVGRSFVYDEKETKYHYSNKYKAFISADAFLIISRQSFQQKKQYRNTWSAADYILT